MNHAGYVTLSVAALINAALLYKTTGNLIAYHKITKIQR